MSVEPGARKTLSGSTMIRVLVDLGQMRYKMSQDA
jgi:hypothetical protein